RIYSHSLIRSLKPPTKGSPFCNASPAVRIITSLLISTNIYLELSSHLGLDVSAFMTHMSKV
uniref:Ovule protein n=1 Tax=Mesocestoides corti TaxID=53468 RepID=A0A5K3FY53_MESCO